MSDFDKNILRWVLLIGAAPIWWPFLRILWRDFNDALREEGGLFGRRPSALELERIQSEKASSPPTLTHEPFAQPGERVTTRAKSEKPAGGSSKAQSSATGRSRGAPRFR